MKTILLIPLIGLTAVLSPAPANAQVLDNGNFESPVQTHPDGFSRIFTGGEPQGFGWTVASGTVDLIGSFWTASSGMQSLDLTGTSAGSIFQDILFPTTGSYRIRFLFSGNPDGGPAIKTMRADFGPATGTLASVGSFTFDSTGSSLASMGWRLEQTADLNVTGGTIYRIQFTSLNSGSYGPALDDVSIIAVPEPAVGALSVACAIGVLFLRAAAKGKSNS